MFDLIKTIYSDNIVLITYKKRFDKHCEDQKRFEQSVLESFNNVFEEINDIKNQLNSD